MFVIVKFSGLFVLMPSSYFNMTCNMKRTNLADFILYTFVGVVLIIVFIFVILPQPKRIAKVQEPEPTIEEIFANLQKSYLKNHNFIDSTNNVLNKDFNYDKSVIGFIHTASHSKLLTNIPFYGMIDGKNGFIFSTFFRDISDIRVLYIYQGYYVAIDEGNTVFVLHTLDNDNTEMKHI